jgi:hypothetical protein
MLCALADTVTTLNTIKPRAHEMHSLARCIFIFFPENSLEQLYPKGSKGFDLEKESFPHYRKERIRVAPDDGGHNLLQIPVFPRFPGHSSRRR